METNNANESKEIESSMSGSQASAQENLHFDVVIVGAGSGGVAVSSSLLKRNGNLRIALVDPATKHYYQPGWTASLARAPALLCRFIKNLMQNFSFGTR